MRTRYYPTSEYLPDGKIVRTESDGEECYINANDFKAWLDLQMQDVSLSPSQQGVYNFVREQVHALDEFQLGERLMRRFDKLSAKQII